MLTSCLINKHKAYRHFIVEALFSETTVHYHAVIELISVHTPLPSRHALRL